MRQLLLMLALLLSVQGGGIASAGSLPGAAPEGDPALEQWAAGLEPVCEFPVTEDYPGVILELFDRLIEWENGKSPDSRITRADLRSLTVYGTREEFFVAYVFDGELEHAAQSGGAGSEPFEGMVLQVRMRRIDDTAYGLLARGGGPLAYGLVPTDLTLESLESDG